MGKNHQTGKIFSRLTGDRPKKSHVVVKVVLEAPIDDDGEVEELNVYTEDYLLCSEEHIRRGWNHKQNKEGRA